LRPRGCVFADVREIADAPLRSTLSSPPPRHHFFPAPLWSIRIRRYSDYHYFPVLLPGAHGTFCPKGISPASLPNAFFPLPYLRPRWIFVASLVHLFPFFFSASSGLLPHLIVRFWSTGVYLPGGSFARNPFSTFHLLAGLFFPSFFPSLEAPIFLPTFSPLTGGETAVIRVAPSPVLFPPSRSVGRRHPLPELSTPDQCFLKPPEPPPPVFAAVPSPRALCPKSFFRACFLVDRRCWPPLFWFFLKGP